MAFREYSFDDVLEAIKKQNKEYDLEIIKKAFLFGEEAHKGQFRKSGESYFNHPIATAIIVIGLGMDTDSIVSALLHDVVEDTEYTLQDIAGMGFSQQVLDALAMMTHDKAVPYMDYVERLKENPIAKTVKLADLRHNSDLSRLDTVDKKALARIEKYKQAIAKLTE